MLSGGANEQFKDQIRQRIETQHKLMRGRKQNDVNQIRKASETIYTEQIPSRIDLKTNRLGQRSSKVIPMRFLTLYESYYLSHLIWPHLNFSSRDRSTSLTPIEMNKLNQSKCKFQEYSLSHRDCDPFWFLFCCIFSFFWLWVDCQNLPCGGLLYSKKHRWKSERFAGPVNKAVIIK